MGTYASGNLGLIPALLLHPHLSQTMVQDPLTFIEIAHRYVAIMRDKDKVLSYPRERVDMFAHWIVACYNLFSLDCVSTKREIATFQSSHFSNTTLGLFYPSVTLFSFFGSQTRVTSSALTKWYREYPFDLMKDAPLDPHKIAYR
jgi:hypothetical protein